jgi:ABC-type amino acid transport substrate-binding protein
LAKLFLITTLFCFSSFCRAQNSDTLYVNYYSQAPFALNDNGDSKGVEIEIISEYVAWLKAVKKMEPPVKFAKFTDWDQFFSKTKSSPKNTIGLGSVTINAERLKEIDFTSAYLKNVSFCITNGNAPEIKTKNPDEIVRVLGNMTALTLTNSTLNKYVNDIKKSYIQDLKITARSNEIQILDEISKNILYFGYVDAVGFWFYLKNNPQKFLKMQKVLNQSKEELAFILPKGSQHKTLFNEFFNGAAGFKKSKNYKLILEKYLGPYMTQTMAIN